MRALASGSMAVLVLVLILLSGQATVVAGELFQGTPHVDHVRQGKLGTCYVHAVLAATALSHPEWLTKRSKSLAGIPGIDAAFEVNMANARTEWVFRSDVVSSRKKGFDRSTGGLWVGAWIRAYGQSVLREAVIDFVSKTQYLAPDARTWLAAWLKEDRVLVPVYDRVIRSVVAQNGEINATTLKARFVKQLRTNDIPAPVAASVIKFADKIGFIAVLESVVKKNPSVFGAWRVIGKGGVPEKAATRMFGCKCETSNPGTKSVGQLKSMLSDALSKKSLVIAAGHSGKTGKPKWYVDSHAFAVLGINGNSVTVRNPWASKPKPFQVPISQFRSCFNDLEVCR